MATLQNPLPPSVERVNNNEARISVRVDLHLGPTDFERIARGAKYYVKCAVLEKDPQRDEWLFGFTREQVFTMSGTYTATEVMPRSFLDTEWGPEELFARYKVIVIEGGVKKNEVVLDSAVAVVQL